MSKRIPIPSYVKPIVRKALKERLKTGAGLTKKEADVLGISSGVQRARQLRDSKTISEDDAKAIARFYLRFRNRDTARSKNAVNLWGGKTYGKLLVKQFYPKTAKRLKI